MRPRNARLGAALTLAGLAAVGLLLAAPGGEDTEAGVPPGVGGDSYGPASPRARAIALHLQGLDALARDDEREAFHRMRAAWEADPGYLPALVDLLEPYRGYLPDDVREVLESFAARAGEESALCFRVALAVVDRRPIPRAPGDGTCATYARLAPPYPRPDPEEGAALRARLWRRHPGSLDLAVRYASALAGLRAWDELLALSGELTDGGRHPLLRVWGFGIRAIGLHGLGRHREAVAAEAEGDAHTREAEPPVRLAYLRGLGLHDHLLRAGDSSLAAHAGAVLEEVRESRDLGVEGSSPFAVVRRVLRAEGLLDHGNLTESLREWDALVALAERAAWPDLEAHVHMRRGRTLVKLGELEAAERDLLAARELAARTRPLQRRYEVEHNLLHLYEARGWDEQARRAGEAFVALTRRGGLNGVRMMSYRDYGRFLQRRGEHEAARRLFEAMVADIDSLDAYRYFAGEYYERIGDLDRARSEYRRVRPGEQVEYRTLSALARVAEATGDLQAAIRYARSHDAVAHRRYPENMPLLPGLLARAGRPDEAAAALRTAREAARARGQVASWAKLTLELAALELERGAFARAAALADSAAAAAGRVAEAEGEVRARATGALARLRRGGAGSEDALAQLRTALRRAERIRLPRLQAEICVMLGEGLVALGHTEEGLVAFERAAILIDSVAASLGDDVERAGYRAAQLRASNRALAAILERAADPRAPEWYAGWSVRRKGRGILDGTPADAGIPDNGGSGVLPRLRSLLDDQRAVVDYVVLDTAVAALVVTREAARLLRLPLTAEALRKRVEALSARLAPRVGSFVDLSRASFDIGAARALYRDLLLPLERALGGRRRLTVVPDGPLHLVPFDALVAGGPGSAPVFAIERYTIALATSLAPAASPERGQRADGGLRAGPVVAASGPAREGPPVAAEREVRAIAGALSDRKVVRLGGPGSTEGAIRRLFGSAAVLHFAAHARPNAHRPDFAHVALAPDGEDDGLLHAYEIRNLPLPGSLVVLSACESAAGRVVGGEGPLSLSRAFLQAGASGVVATLWPVGPAAADLMETFYRELARGRPTADALRAAKLSLRRGDRSEPFYWAAFTLVTAGV